MALLVATDLFLLPPDERRVSLPAAAPSLLRCGAEVAWCFVAGDFLIYWEVGPLSVSLSLSLSRFSPEVLS